jgi:hypothetical protein
MPTRLERQRRIRELHRALVADVQAEIQLALKVGTLTAMGFRRYEVARLLGASPADFKLAVERLQRVAPLLARDSDL